MAYGKKRVMRLILTLEMLGFSYVYFYGKKGLQSLNHHKNVVMDLKNNILHLDQEIALLEKEIYVWQSDDFYKEKIAREQLQMARKDDELFYIGA